MESAQLQLAINVIGITGVSSLTWFCYLLRKENRKLADELKAGPTRAESGSTAAAQSSPQRKASIPGTVQTTTQDIRHLAANRRSGWVEGLASAISHD